MRVVLTQDNGSERHTLFHYGLQGKLLGETRLHANQPSQTHNIVWLQNRPVAVHDSSHSETEQQNPTPSIAWLHSDHLLTARAATDADQNLIWRWHSDAFGMGEAESLTATNNPAAPSLTLNLRFPGQYHDEESGLYYNYFRTYDPNKGRYTQSDPIGLAGGISTFGYVYGSPVGYVDPLGLYTEIIIWQPVRYGSSSFGHVSANINGVNYSWGPGGWDTNPSAEVYAANQTNFRSGVGTVLSLSTEQEKKLIECYTKKRKEYSVWTNNCGDPHKECLEEALGHSISSSFFPVSIGNDLLSSPYYSSSKFYEGPDRGFWDDAPWAR